MKKPAKKKAKVNGKEHSLVIDCTARLQLIRSIIAEDSQSKFAQEIGMSLSRWNNFERGYPLPRDEAVRLCKKFPGLTTDWIWFGYFDLLSPEWQKKIEKHQPRVDAAFVKLPWKR